MSIDFTARGSGYYRVLVNGDPVSQHTTEREALERATEIELEDPTRHVQVTHDYTVDVEAAGSAPADPPADDPPEDPPAEEDPPEEDPPADDPPADDPPEDPPADDDPPPDDDTGGVIVPPPSGVWLAQDWNFPSTAAMQSAPNMEGAGNAGGRGESRPIVLAQPGPWGGTRALENHFETIPADHQPQVATNWYFPRTERELWLETWIRFGPEWEIGPGNPLYPGGNVDHKTIFIWEENWRRWECKFGPNWGDCVASAATHDVYYGYMTKPNGQRMKAQDDVWDAQWHRFRIHCRIGAGDGRMGVWWDADKVIDRQNLNTQSGSNRFMGITFGGNRNQGTNHPMSFFYGPARLYRADPGW